MEEWNKMKELEDLLINIEDSYYDFISGIMNYAKGNEDRRKKLIDYIKANPEVKSSDVVKFVSDQPDFFEQLDE